MTTLFLSNANAQTMPVLVAAQNTTRGPLWWYMSVLIVIMIAPVIAIAGLLQKHIGINLCPCSTNILPATESGTCAHGTDVRGGSCAAPRYLRSFSAVC